MAFGFPPKRTQGLLLEDISSEHFLVLAIQAAKNLHWKLGPVTISGLNIFTKFSWASMAEEIKIEIDGSQIYLKSECIGYQLWDWGKNKRNLKRFIAELNQLMSNYSTEELDIKFTELEPTLISEEAFENLQPPSSKRQTITSFRSIFEPRDDYYFTPILVNINIGYYLLMVIFGVNFLHPDITSMIDWGANYRGYTLSGQWWRVLTCCFLHYGLLHLIANMMALIYIGLLLEPLIGGARFLAAYLIIGIFSSVYSLWWHEFVISAGASGAIFGLYGIFLALLTTNFVEKAARKAFLISTGFFILYTMMSGQSKNTDNAAHFGGLLCGMVVGYCYALGLKNKFFTKKGTLQISIICILGLGSSFALFKIIPKDLAIYKEKLIKFDENQQIALSIYDHMDHETKLKMTRLIKDSGINYWQENIKLLNDISHLKIPAKALSLNEKLLEYCQLRIDTYQLLYKTLMEDTHHYDDSITIYNTKLNHIMEQINPLLQTQ